MVTYLAFMWGDKEINVESTAASYIYLHALKGIKEIKQHRINIMIRTPNYQDDKYWNEPQKFISDRFWVTPLPQAKGVITVMSGYDKPHYKTLNREQKISVQVNLIHDCLEFLFQYLNIDFEPIRYLKDKIIESNLNIDLPVKIKIKRQPKPRLSYKAELWVKPDFYSFDYYLILNEGQSKIRSLTFKGNFAYMLYESLIFHQMECSSNSIEIYSRDRKIVFCYTVATGELEIKYIDM